LLEQLLFTPRLLLRAFDDLHRIADAAVSAAATMRALHEEAAGLRAAFGPLRDDMDALRAAFAGADAELEALRESFVPEVERIRGAVDALRGNVANMPIQLGALDSDFNEIGSRLASELASLHATIYVLVREADEMRQVVEPLQSATERVGRVANKLPGGS
jgi:ABC-type transporter Mla subunit MlaD